MCPRTLGAGAAPAGQLSPQTGGRADGQTGGLLQSPPPPLHPIPLPRLLSNVSSPQFDSTQIDIYGAATKHEELCKGLTHKG